MFPLFASVLFVMLASVQAQTCSACPTGPATDYSQCILDASALGGSGNITAFTEASCNCIAKYVSCSANCANPFRDGPYIVCALTNDTLGCKLTTCGDATESAKGIVECAKTYQSCLLKTPNSPNQTLPQVCTCIADYLTCVAYVPPPAGTSADLYQRTVLSTCQSLTSTCPSISCAVPPNPCQNPVGSCDYYSNCVEKVKPCGNAGYALSFGKPHCEVSYAFSKDRLSSPGNIWNAYIQLCIQRQLAGLDFSSMTCDQIAEAGIKAQRNCPLSAEPNYCQLSSVDHEAISKHVRDFIETSDYQAIVGLVGKGIFDFGTCLSKNILTFEIRLVNDFFTLTIAEIINLINTVIRAVLNEFRLDSQSFVFKNIWSGSTVIQFQVSLNETQAGLVTPQDILNFVSDSALNGTLFGGSYNVTSVTISEGSTFTTSSSSNGGMVAGIVIGVLFGVLALVIIIYVLMSKSPSNESMEHEYDRA